MFIDKNSLQVKKSGGNYVSLGNYITEVTYAFHKIWGTDTGRNLAGRWGGTLIGIFPKITIQFRKLNKTEIETLVPILDNAKQTLKYYDPFKKTSVEIDTYTGDYEYINKSIIDLVHKANGFQISFIAVSRRA